MPGHSRPIQFLHMQTKQLKQFEEKNTFIMHLSEQVIVYLIYFGAAEYFCCRDTIFSIKNISVELFFSKNQNLYNIPRSISSV